MRVDEGRTEKEGGRGGITRQIAVASEGISVLARGLHDKAP